MLGPNGSGKTTLLRILSGALAPSTGTVHFDGAPIDALPKRQLARRLAVVPQEIHPVFDYTVLDLALMGRYAHLGPFGFETAARPAGRPSRAGRDRHGGPRMPSFRHAERRREAARGDRERARPVRGGHARREPPAHPRRADGGPGPPLPDRSRAVAAPPRRRPWPDAARDHARPPVRLAGLRSRGAAAGGTRARRRAHGGDADARAPAHAVWRPRRPHDPSRRDRLAGANLARRRSFAPDVGRRSPTLPGAPR